MSEISNNAFVLNSHKASEFLLRKGNTSSDAIRRFEERNIYRDDEWRDEDCWDNDYIVLTSVKKSIRNKGDLF